MSDRLVTERELEGILRKLQALETRQEREKSEVPITASGTWTPAFAGLTTPGIFTYTAFRYGFWRRSGPMIFLSGALQISAIPTPPTGNMAITGLPFTSVNATGYRAGVEWAVIDQFNFAATAMQLHGVLVENSSVIQLGESFDNAAFVASPAANFTNVNCDLQFSLVYFIA